MKKCRYVNISPPPAGLMAVFCYEGEPGDTWATPVLAFANCQHHDCDSQTRDCWHDDDDSEHRFPRVHALIEDGECGSDLLDVDTFEWGAFLGYCLSYKPEEWREKATDRAHEMQQETARARAKATRAKP